MPSNPTPLLRAKPSDLRSAHLSVHLWSELSAEAPSFLHSSELQQTSASVFSISRDLLPEPHRRVDCVMCAELAGCFLHRAKSFQKTTESGLEADEELASIVIVRHNAETLLGFCFVVVVVLAHRRVLTQQHRLWDSWDRHHILGLL